MLKKSQLKQTDLSKSCWRQLTKKAILRPLKLVTTWISNWTSFFFFYIKEILTQYRSGEVKKRENLGKSCRILEGNVVSWFVSWYHSLHCLSISKGPWLSEFLMAPLSSCAVLIVEQKRSCRNTGINCGEYKLANQFIPHTNITNKYWWLPAV